MPFEHKPSAPMAVLTAVYLALAIWFVGMLVGSSINSAWLALSQAAATQPAEPATDQTADTPAISPSSFIAFAIGSQLAFAGGATALVLLLNTRRTKARPALSAITNGLNLRAPAIKLWVWPLLIGANLFLWVAVSVGFTRLFPDPGEHLKDLGDSVAAVNTPLIAALTLLAVGILPGIGEEFIFRGFVLRQIKHHVPAWFAILLVATLFAASHIDPMQALLIFPLGLWWTILAWRARSAWPAIAMHALNNSWTLLWAWSLMDTVNELPPAGIVAILIATLLCFIGAVVAICGPGIKRQPPAENAAPLPTENPSTENP